MYPWLFFWAPQVHFPWSGNVSQDIEPHTTWFADLIQPGAGNARIEEKAFGVASYGKQLGHLTDLLIELAEQPGAALSPDGKKTLDSLRTIRQSIEAIKADEYQNQAQRLVAELENMRQHGGAAYEQLVRQLQPLLLLERKS
jgi:hypothetical protein